MEGGIPQKIPEEVRLAILRIFTEGMTRVLLLPKDGHQKL